MRIRDSKTKLAELLVSDDMSGGLEEIALMPEKKVINTLFSFFYSYDLLIKWRAITAAGVVVKKISAHDMGYARNIMRRLMWNMNDESGGIGWGSPEAMGEIMAGSKDLAGEYHTILISYIMPDGNFIENELLQRGVLWGIGRLAHATPELLRPHMLLLTPYLKSTDPFIRGFAAWTASLYHTDQLKAALNNLEQDHETLSFYTAGQLKEITVSDLAKGRC